MKMPSTKALGQLAQALGMTMTELMGQAEDVDLFDDADSRQMPLALALRGPQSQQRRFALRDEPFEEHAQLDRPVARFEAARQIPGDRRLEELIRTIVRAEMAAWARTKHQSPIGKPWPRLRKTATDGELTVRWLRAPRVAARGSSCMGSR